MAEFNKCLEHKPGKENCVTNALSKKAGLAAVCQLKGNLLEQIKMRMLRDPAGQGLLKLAREGKTQMF